MLTISNRERIIIAMDEALQLMKSRADYYNLQNDEEVFELLNKLQAIRTDLQQKNEEGYARLARDNSQANGTNLRTTPQTTADIRASRQPIRNKKLTDFIIDK